MSDIDQVISLLKQRKIGVLPTDTIYGIHCLAGEDSLLSKVYELKGREENIPLITLISNTKELEKFGLVIGDFERKVMNQYWPGPNTLIFKNSLGGSKSFRLPKSSFLTSILIKTGPLISTSANIHGMPSSKNIHQAISYFGEKVDFYVDGGDLNNPPSSIYKLEQGSVTKIR